MNWASRSSSVQSCLKLSAFWCFCFLAIIAFGVSSLLALTAAKGAAKFLFAIVSVVTASIVHKLVILILHVALLRRGRSSLAVALESILSDWPESCIITIAVLKGMTTSAYNILIGFVAVKFFLLLSICSFFLGGRRKESKSYPTLVGMLHTRLLVISLLTMLAQTFAQSAIRGKPGLKNSDSEWGVALLAHITALALLLTFICHHVVVGRTHSPEARRANGLSMIVRPRGDSADFNTFARRPTLRLTSYVAERFQDCRDAHFDSISESSSRPNSNSIRDTTVTSIILAAACVIILVSSHHLVDSITLENTERLSTWQRLNILLTTSLVGLTECVAVCVNTWRPDRSTVAEEVSSAALGSTARLLSALVSVSTIIGWSLGMEASVLPVDAFHYALLVVALLMQWIGEGWITGFTLLIMYVLFVAKACSL